MWSAIDGKKRSRVAAAAIDPINTADAVYARRDEYVSVNCDMMHVISFS